MLRQWIQNLLLLPDLRGLTPYDPKTVELWREIIQNKKLIYDLYAESYRYFAKITQRIPPGLLVELGSGSGFIKNFIPGVITNDIIQTTGIDRVFSAEQIPFSDNTVSAFFLRDVFHHLPQPERFLKEAVRCLCPYGRIVLIEPANTFIGKFINHTLHHERFDEKSGWELTNKKSISDSNMALPWIIFFRDYTLFRKKFPELVIRHYFYHTWLLFLLAGGVRYRSLIPEQMLPLIRFIERIFKPLNRFIGMYITIEIERLP